MSDPRQFDMGAQLSTVDFHGQVLQIVDKAGCPYVPIRRICVNLGLDYSAQRQRILRDAVLGEGVVMITTPSSGGDQETLCLPLEFLNGWLFGIDDRRVAAEIREPLILYKREAYAALHGYFMKGYALNEPRLRQDNKALDELAAKVRGLRAEEQNIYQAVRDVFAFSSIDYSKEAPEAHFFFAKTQDKFLYAVTGKTAAQIKLSRANHRSPSMGLHSMRGGYPVRADVDIGKNYLDGPELYSLHILCEQFLLFVESKAARGIPLTMAELSAKFDELLIVQGHSVFTGYNGPLAQKAKAHAHREFDLWRERVKKLPPTEMRAA